MKAPVASSWEFWPTWAWYIPLTPYFVWLAMRHGGLARFAAANPGIPMGGIVGESKYAILQHLRGPHALPMLPLETPGRPDPSASAQTMQTVQAWMDQHNIIYPIIVKPDIGERGTGVRLIHTREALVQRLDECNISNDDGCLLVQAYDPGPCEAGVFYTRLPSQPRGTIFSITHKVFPAVTGDGQRDIASLIDSDDRLRLQRAVFHQRFAGRLSQVPGAGVRVPLGIAGNHCQGTKFLDGSHLKTDALSAAIDAVARQIPGFYFGRFDIRYDTPENLRAGRGFTVVEVNGVLSESTNIYDPERSYFAGLRTLAQQWELAFRIGGMNARGGSPVPGLRAILEAVRIHLNRPGAGASAD